jgi:hypothetical protein
MFAPPDCRTFDLKPQLDRARTNACRAQPITRLLTMNLHMPPRTFWSTASFGDAADTSPLELNELGQHMQQCSQPRTHWLALRQGAQTVHQGLLAV